MTEFYRLYKLFKLDTEGKKRVTKKEGFTKPLGASQGKKKPHEV